MIRHRQLADRLSCMDLTAVSLSLFLVDCRIKSTGRLIHLKASFWTCTGVKQISQASCFYINKRLRRDDGIKRWAIGAGVGKRTRWRRRDAAVVGAKVAHLLSTRHPPLPCQGELLAAMPMHRGQGHGQQTLGKRCSSTEEPGGDNEQRWEWEDGPVDGSSCLVVMSGDG